MENNHHNLPLDKAYTFFLVPFYYENDDWNIIHEERLNKWIPITEELYNEDVLYPYIMDLFKQYSTSQDTRLDIFEFKSVNENRAFFTDFDKFVNFQQNLCSFSKTDFSVIFWSKTCG